MRDKTGFMEMVLQHPKRKYYITGLFWLCTILLYNTGHRSLLVDDALQGIWYMKYMGLKEFRDSFGYSGFYYGHFVVFKLIYSICGIDTLRWFLVFSFMHALNSMLLFSFCDQLYRGLDVRPKSSAGLAFSGALLFLVSPYHSENILWGATSHYFVTLFLLLWIGKGILNYFTGVVTPLRLILLHLAFAFALVTLEISFLFPVIFYLLFLLFLWNRKTEIRHRSYILQIVLPQLGLIALYFLCLKLKYGYWIPYGREGKDVAVAFSYMITTLTQHLMKLWGFIHFTNYSTRSLIYGWALQWGWSLLFLLTLFSGTSLWLVKKSKQRLSVFWFFLFTGLILYAPFIRMYFMYLFRLEGNRYSYFSSAFLMPALIIIFSVFSIRIRIVLTGLAIGLSLFFIFPTVHSYRKAARLHSKFLNQFPDMLKGRIFLLNVPYNCSDAYVFRETPRLTMALNLYKNGEWNNKVTIIAWYNAQTVSDAFAAARISENTYVIQQKTPGSWWMYEHLGATNYENDLYRFETGEGNSCTITFKQTLKPDDAVLFFNGKRFIRLNE